MEPQVFAWFCNVRVTKGAALLYWEGTLSTEHDCAGGETVLATHCMHGLWRAF